MSAEAAAADRPVRSAIEAALLARPYLAIVLLLGLLYVPWLAAIPLGGTLEANRLESAREMLRSGDWIVPRLGGTAYLAKPPFFPWTLAASSAPFGDVSAFGGRLVSVLAALGSCCLVFAWGRRRLGEPASMFAALVLGSSVLFAEKAVRAELEIELVLFSSLALLALWAAGSADRMRSAHALGLLSGVCLCAATLVKGPPPILIYASCAAAMAIALPARRRALLAAAGWAITLSVAGAAAWLVPLCARVGTASAWRSFEIQFLNRITQPGHTNQEPPWFYGPALLVGLMPATACLPCLASVLPSRFRESEREQSLSLFLWSWAIPPILLLSLSAGKETRYLLPVMPAWALLLGWGWSRTRANGQLAAWRGVLRRGLAIGSWALPVAWIAFGWMRFADARPIVLGSGLALLAVRSAFVRRAGRARPALALALLAAGLAACKVAWAGTVLAEDRRSEPVEEVGRAIRARVAAGRPWALIGPYRSWLTFGVDRPCVNLAAWDSAPTGAAEVVLAPDSMPPPRSVGARRTAGWVIDGDRFSLYEVSPCAEDEAARAGPLPMRQNAH